MKTVLLPVKDFQNAKQRLGCFLVGGQRPGLARAMLSDVLAALAGSKEAQRVIVFTASEDVAGMVMPFGFDLVGEASVDGHSAAVNQMLDRLSPDSSMILALASDLPTLTAREIDFVLSTVAEPFTILPSRDGTGTNGLVFRPPARISVEYGEGSFRRHMSKAWAAGLRSEVLNIPGFAFDIDTPQDLEHFMMGCEPEMRNTFTWKYLNDLRR